MQAFTVNSVSQIGWNMAMVALCGKPAFDRQFVVIERLKSDVPWKWAHLLCSAQPRAFPEGQNIKYLSEPAFQAYLDVVQH